MEKLISLSAMAALLAGCAAFHSRSDAPLEKASTRPVEEQPVEQAMVPAPQDKEPAYKPPDFPAPEGALQALSGEFFKGTAAPGFDPYTSPRGFPLYRDYYWYHRDHDDDDDGDEDGEKKEEHKGD